MKKGGIGGANTQTGIHFEGRVDILKKLAELPGYKINGNIIYYEDEEVARSYRENSGYTYPVGTRINVFSAYNFGDSKSSGVENLKQNSLT